MKDEKELREYVSYTLRKQFALDYNICAKDFDNKETLVVEAKQIPGRRVREEEGILSILSYNGKLVISAKPEILPWCKETLASHISPEWYLEAGTIISIDKKLAEYGYGIDQAHLFFTPSRYPENSNSNITLLEKPDIAKFEEDERIDEAFLFEDYVDDVLGCALFNENEDLQAIAGATANSSLMWELGVNSFEEGNGYAKAVLSSLIFETLERNKVPYYGTSLSHLASQRLALKCSMVPTFTELTTCKL